MSVSIFNSRLALAALVSIFSILVDPFAAQADVLCVAKTATVNKKGQLPLGSQMILRKVCAKNEIPVFDTSVLSGPKGEAGLIGATGAQGPKGDKGDTGPQGVKGDTGLQGPKGDQGDTGPQGAKGDKGDTGLQGLKGDKGDKGDIGLTGPQGSKGDKGDAGIQGLKGDKGDTGAQGAQGNKGDTGLQGPKGDKGDRGDKGDTGARGPVGGSMMPWLEVSTDTTLEANIGYIATGGNDVKLTLPTDLAVGDVIQIREGIQPTNWSLVRGAPEQRIQGLEGLEGAGNRSWSDIAVSDDGQKLAAATGTGDIFTSSDAGRTWTQRTGPSSLQRISLSSDGARIIATSNDTVFVSQDGGASWSQSQPTINSPNSYIQALAASGDGLKIVVATYDTLWTTVDGGTSWTSSSEVLGLRGYRSVAISADGARLVVIVNDDDSSSVLISSDGGINWKKANIASPAASSSISGDGLKIAVSTDAGLMISTDGGDTWANRGQPTDYASWSKDGSTLFSLRQQFVSRTTDNGVTWQRIAGSASGALQNSLRSNADGSTFYSINCFNWSGPWTCYPYSSSLSTVSEIHGTGAFKLIYLGSGVFSPTN